jgi:3-deoxy-7-phosphoheptulonate synthase
MIVVMKRSATKDMVQQMVKRVESMGLKAHVLVGTERTVIAAIGTKREGAVEVLSSYEEVEKVVPILAPYKVASREAKPEPTVVRVRDLVIGCGSIGVIAGPCSVESEEQIMQAAVAVKECGAKVMTPQHVELVCQYADVLQIGARNMQNYHLLQAVGETKKAVLLKRGPAATIDEFLLAAEYVLDQGNSQVVLCERGIRTFETHTRFTLPLATVPYLHERTHLPVVVDPSHGTGIASLIPAMSLAAIAAGCDGLIVEVHPDPHAALSDGDQSITPAAFAKIMEDCRKVATALGRTL